MINKIIKLIIAAAITIFAIYQMFDDSIGNGIMLLLLAGVFVFLYYKNEFLLLAFLQMRKQNLEGTQKWLDKITNPESVLIKSQQAYFYYMQGLLTIQKNMTQGEKLFKKALSIGLRMNHDIAMAKLNLAGVAMSKRRKMEATTLLNEAKKLDKHGMLGDQIKMMKDQLKKI